MSNGKSNYRIVDTVSGAHFSLFLDYLPQLGSKIRLNALVVLTVVEFNLPNSIVVTSNASYDEVMRAING